ncbi:unnamed protein product [Closterium sp. Naga37s-1]|nr:unnamed protein product [Closterium sp. Naga37s-1]
MELQLVNGMVLKVQLEEMAGGVGERVAALEAKLREQGDAMAAMQRDMAETSRAMALLKGMAATGALGEKIAGEGAGNGSASGEAAEGIGAEPRKNIFAALEVEEVKARVETMRAEARDVASELRGEMGALKAEIARMRAAAERQAAEVAYVKATEAHSEARINDVELALAAIKDGQAEKSREGRNEGSGGEGEGTERREGKRRKREEVGEKVGVIAAGGAPEGKRDAEEREGEAQGVGNGAACDTKAELKGLRERVEALEAVSAVGGKTWEVSAPDGRSFFLFHLRTSCSWVTDSSMKRLRNMKRLEKLGIWDATITAAGIKWLKGLKWLQTIGTDAEDVAELIRDIFPGMIVTPGPLE